MRPGSKAIAPRRFSSSRRSSGNIRSRCISACSDGLRAGGRKLGRSAGDAPPWLQQGPGCAGHPRRAPPGREDRDPVRLEVQATYRESTASAFGLHSPRMVRRCAGLCNRQGCLRMEEGSQACGNVAGSRRSMEEQRPLRRIPAASFRRCGTPPQFPKGAFRPSIRHHEFQNPKEEQWLAKQARFGTVH